MSLCEIHRPGRWATYSILKGGRLPNFAGVYAVYFDADLVYVGQSCDVSNRFYDHKIRHGYSKTILTPWGDVPPETSITVKVKRSARRGDWAMWEIRLIHRLQPRFNQHHRGRLAA